MIAMQRIYNSEQMINTIDTISLSKLSENSQPIEKIINIDIGHINRILDDFGSNTKIKIELAFNYQLTFLWA